MSNDPTSRDTSDGRSAAPGRALERAKMGRRDVLSQLAWVASASPLVSVLGCGSEDGSGEGQLGSGVAEPGGASGDGAVGAADAGSTSAAPGATTTVTEAIDPAPPLTSPPMPPPPSWDEVPTCAASNTDGAGQGPFFIHDAEREDDVSLFRQDIRGRQNENAEPGTEMVLHLRILDARSADCEAAPVAGVEVYIWHTD